MLIKFTENLIKLTTIMTGLLSQGECQINYDAVDTYSKINEMFQISMTRTPTNVNMNSLVPDFQ
jgi:hypothetical protein